MFPRQKGFTLIELSIVLVIIGLIVGGVLVGRDLIEAAGVRAQVTQMEKYQQAVNTFRVKYNALPGDMDAFTAATFGFTPRGVYAGEGDGSFYLHGVSSNGPGNNYGWLQVIGETPTFWVDLTSANGLNVNLIEGKFSTGSPNAAASGPWNTPAGIGRFLPTAKLGTNFIYVYSNTGLNNAIGTTFDGAVGYNYFGISNVTNINTTVNGCTACLTSVPGLSVRQAYSIDGKIDDGLPATGNVVAQYLDAASFGGSGYGAAPNAGSPSASTCYDTGSLQYSITQNNGSGVNCALSFKFK